MISVQNAEKCVLSQAKNFGTEVRDLLSCSGYVLAENVYADRDQPPIKRSSMDGVAIAYSAWQKGQRHFILTGVQRAGIARLSLENLNHAMEIMTGAVLPHGTDTVIPIEDYQQKGPSIHVNPNANMVKGNFVRDKASEYKKGKLLLSQGDCLSPNHIAVAASVGKTKLKVLRQPQIAIVGTGDELIPINQFPKEYQARQSNGYGVRSLLEMNGFINTKIYHLNDHPGDIFINLKKIFKEVDVVILSGGVSKGKFDFVPQILKKLGVRILFHTVSQRPGKPFGFGMTKQGQAVFALPGNPISTQVCATRYVLPFLKRGGGMNTNVPIVQFKNTLNLDTSLTHFLPVQIRTDGKGQGTANPIVIKGSGDYGALPQSDGFVEVTSPHLKKNQYVRFYPWIKK